MTGQQFCNMAPWTGLGYSSDYLLPWLQWAEDWTRYQIELAEALVAMASSRPWEPSTRSSPRGSAPYPGPMSGLPPTYLAAFRVFDELTRACHAAYTPWQSPARSRSQYRNP